MANCNSSTTMHYADAYVWYVSRTNTMDTKMTEQFDRYEEHLAKQNLHVAKNTTGYLIRVFDKLMFRQYHSDKTFTDYDILHHDLEVTITDSDAVFDNLHNTLDYAP